jgi:putative serine protease PepD
MSSPDSPASASPGAPARRARPRVGRLLIGFAVAALVGGVIGGVLVALLTPSTRVASTRVTFCNATQVAGQGLPSVVTISAGGADPSSGSGTGSGELIADGGYILTNDHVIAVAADGGRLSVRYSDGQSSKATLVGRDPLTDLAVIKADDGASGRPIIPIGSSSGLQVGQPVVALGAPLGLSSTVTAGIISALDRHVPVPSSNAGTAHLVGAIQTDAAINPGNSGGALVNCGGELIGVNTAIATVPNANGDAGGGSVGLGFAIPVDLAEPISAELIKTGQVAHTTLGLQVQQISTSTDAASAAPAGLFVLSVAPGSPAAKAGMHPGDVITTVNGATAVSSDQLTVAEIQGKTGQDVELTYVRDGQEATVLLTPVAMR